MAQSDGAALVATALALIGLASGGGVWFVQQRAERRRGVAQHEVGTAVAQAGSFRKQFHFHEARELLEQARQRLQPAGPDDLRRQVDQARADLALAENLDTARLRAATPVEGRIRAGRSRAAVRGGVREGRVEPTGRQQRGGGGAGPGLGVCASKLSPPWMTGPASRRIKSRRAWLLAVARGADPDPLRDRLREPELWQDGAELTKLVQELRSIELSPQLLTALGRELPKTRGGGAAADRGAGTLPAGLLAQL